MGRRYRYEPVALALVALTMLVVVKPPNVQDHTRLSLTEAIVRNGSLEIDQWQRGRQGDFSMYGGHYYTDKAPGLSWFALPETAVSNALPAAEPWGGTWRHWLVRLFVNGPFLLGLCLLLGRKAEELVPGSGAVVAVATGAGTLLGPLSGVLFDHVGASFFLLAAFVLAWDRRPALAGVAAGLSVLWNYTSVFGAVIVGAYVLSHGIRPAVRYAAGVLPSAAALAAYDALAFGSPFHLSYRYVANDFAAQQKSGLFGFHVPSETGLHTVLVAGSGFRPGMGLFMTSSVLFAGALGLALLWRRGLRREAAVCALIAVVYVLWDAGYFAPYGGQSPGPRFAAPAIPFLLIGVPLALERLPVATLALVTASVVTSTLTALAWGTSAGLIPTHLPATVWSLVGAPRAVGVGLAAAAGAAAALLALATVVHPRVLVGGRA